MKAERRYGAHLGENPVIKHDITSALAAASCATSGFDSIGFVRLALLISARYRWSDGTVTIGQTQLAELWSVDRRTVMRTLRRFEDRGYLNVAKPGRRGRVATFALNLERLVRDTRPYWGRIGADIEARLLDRFGDGEKSVCQIVPIRLASDVIPAADTVPDADFSYTALQFLLLKYSAIAEVAVRRWFQSAEHRTNSDGSVHIYVSNSFVADYAARTFETHVLNAFLKAGLQCSKVEFVVGKPLAKTMRLRSASLLSSGEL